MYVDPYKNNFLAILWATYKESCQPLTGCFNGLSLGLMDRSSPIQALVDLSVTLAEQGA